MASKHTKKPEKPEKPVALSALWRQVRREMFDHYRPELYYMRGPGPKWRAKHEVAATSMSLSDTAPARI